jgi:RNA polymerase sigma factor (sigma-70 family)
MDQPLLMQVIGGERMATSIARGGMATSRMDKFIQHVRTSVFQDDVTGPTDGQMLEAFVSNRDEAALAAIVRRHAPMVWGVCHRLLPCHHDAEDAFQATFLVLVRKAASVRPREMVANWLHGVARRTALKARWMATRRRGRERQVLVMPEPEAAERNLWDTLQPALDEELGRLPEKYRAVIVLCDLEDKSRKEAARQLRLREGTVASRLARARTMLAARLARHGVTVPSGMLAAALAHGVASASVPAAVVSSTLKVASLSAAGRATAGLVSVKAAALTEGVLKSMFLTKLKLATGILLVGVLAMGGRVAYLPTVRAEQEQTKQTGLPALQKEADESEHPRKASEDDKEKMKEPTGDLLQGITTALEDLRELDGEPDGERQKKVLKNLKKALADDLRVQLHKALLELRKSVKTIDGKPNGELLKHARDQLLEQIDALENLSKQIDQLVNDLEDLERAKGDAELLRKALMDDLLKWKEKWKEKGKEKGKP